MGYRYLSTDEVEEMRAGLAVVSTGADAIASAVRRAAGTVAEDLTAEAVRLETVASWSFRWRWDLLARLFILQTPPPVAGCPAPMLWLGALRDEQLYEGAFVGRYLSALMTPPGRGDDEILGIELLQLREDSRLLREAFERARHIRSTIGALRGDHDLGDDLEDRLRTGDIEQYLARRGRGTEADVRDLLEHLPDEERRIAIALVLEHASELGYGEDAVERTYLREVMLPVVDAAIDDLHALLEAGLIEKQDLVHGLTVLNGDRELTADEMALLFTETLVFGDELEQGLMDPDGSTLAQVLAQNGEATGDLVGAAYAPVGGYQAVRDVGANVLEGDVEGFVDVAVREAADATVDRYDPLAFADVASIAGAVGAGSRFTTRLELLIQQREGRRRREEADEDDDACDVSPRPPSPTAASRQR